MFIHSIFILGSAVCLFFLLLFSLWKFLMGDEHPSLPNSAAAALAAWTPRLPQPLAGPAAAPVCHLAPHQLVHQDHMMAVPTPQKIYCMIVIKVNNIELLNRRVHVVAPVLRVLKI